MAGAQRTATGQRAAACRAASAHDSAGPYPAPAGLPALSALSAVIRFTSAARWGLAASRRGKAPCSRAAFRLQLRCGIAADGDVLNSKPQPRSACSGGARGAAPEQNGACGGPAGPEVVTSAGAAAALPAAAGRRPAAAAAGRRQRRLTRLAHRGRAASFCPRRGCCQRRGRPASSRSSCGRLRRVQFIGRPGALAEVRRRC